MANIMNNECLVRCKNCSAVVTATWSSSFINKGWRLKDSKGGCPSCRKPIKLKGLETTLCPHCGKLVERTADNRCLNCHKTLVQVPMRDQVECPECGMLVDIPANSKDEVKCSICGTVLPRNLIDLKLGQAAVEQEQYIRLPDVAKMLQEDRAIWKHPQNTFPYKSRMQVNEGTFALFLQNGICKEPCEPGSYLLEDSDLEKSQKFDAAMSDAPVVFNTDIYCVLQDMPEISWGTSVEDLKVSVDRFENQLRSATYTAGSNGRVVLQVCDAKAYARYLGFKPVSISSLLNSNPEPGSSDGVLLQTTRDMLSESLYACLNGMDGAALERLVPNDVRDNLTVELNQRLAQYGLCVKTLWINALSVEKSGGSVAADQVLAWAQSEFNWNVRGARLYAYGDRSMYADMDFDGSFRLRVADEARFFAASEVRAFAANTDVSEFDVKDYFQRKAQNILNNALVITAQDQIDRGGISDMLDRNQYVTALRDRVRSRVNEELEHDGLALGAFSVNMPGNIVKSDALNAQLDQPKRRQAIRRAVESALPLKTEPVRVHLRDDKSIFVDLVFRGICNLRVRDEDTFFRLSEIQGFLTDSRAVSETAVSDYYVKRIDPVFQEVLSRIAQSIVDQTNADIREINRFTGMLKRDVLTGMAPRIETWGLELESLDLNGIDTVDTSPNLGRQAALEETVSGTKLDEEVKRIQNDHIVFVMEEDGRVQMRGKEIKDDIDAKDDEIELRRIERQHLRKMTELQKGAELDKLVDEIAEGKRERADTAVLEEYRRKYRIREEQLNQEIREQRIAQEAELDKARRKQQAEFESKLNEANNKHLLNDIMRKIAESDLDWQQKLDEYDRLRRRVNAETDAEIRQTEANTELKITRDQTNFYLEVEGRKIQLTAEQAELMERINRYAEDRKEREAQANENRLERRATLDFERRMQDRREQVAQAIDQLKVKYDHELAMRERDLDLQKLQAELQYHTETGAQSADVQKVQANADSAARIAEAEAEVRRAQEQLKREETIAKQAEEFRKSLLEIQAALELTRLGNDRNRDDRLAEVGIANAQAVGKTAEKAADRAAERAAERAGGMTDKEYERFRDLERKLDRIVSSVKDLRGQVRDLQKQVPAGFGPVRVGYPVREDGSYYRGPQPGSGSMRVCPTCGRQVDASVKSCPVCYTPLL